MGRPRFRWLSVSDGLLGFSIADGNGHWSGLDVDLCRAIAAAIFNDSSKVKFVPPSAGERSKARRRMPAGLAGETSSAIEPIRAGDGMKNLPARDSQPLSTQ